MTRRLPQKKGATDDELIRAFLETTSVSEVARRVGLHPSTVRRRLRSVQFQARLEAMRGAMKVSASEKAVDPGRALGIDAHWKHQAERYGHRDRGREVVVGSQWRRTPDDGPVGWRVAVGGFAVRLLWAAFQLALCLAAIALLALLALFVRYATVP
jgi:AcrR family transcriptional regulator